MLGRLSLSCHVLNAAHLEGRRMHENPLLFSTCSWHFGEKCFLSGSQLPKCPPAGVTNQMSIDELSPCEEEALPSPAEDEHNQNGNLD